MDWSDRIGRRIRLRDLHIVLAVAESGSMAKASAKLGQFCASSASYRAAASGVTSSRSNNLMRTFSLLMLTSIIYMLKTMALAPVTKIPHVNALRDRLLNGWSRLTR